MRPTPCPRCVHPNFTPHRPSDNPAVYSVGDICAIDERTSTPVYFFLTGDPPPSRTSAGNRISKGSFGFWPRAQSSMGGTSAGGDRSFASRESAARPCVMYDEVDVRSPDARSRVCLFATFDGQSRDIALPEALQRVCIPIYPHHLAAEGQAHCHTTPEWPKEGTWLIGVPFFPAGAIAGRWENRHEGGGKDGSFYLTETEMLHLRRLCAKNRQDWETLCLRDQGLAHRCLKQYKVRFAAVFSNAMVLLVFSRPPLQKPWRNASARLRSLSMH
ncbi:hypothetical protein BV20DRAFT_955222 [Pilatotrama ljubarskyi]|nr:hypothetical protein BV20DRAFT_955222 [Pilatotrama ljubarskyi]